MTFSEYGYVSDRIQLFNVEHWYMKVEKGLQKCQKKRKSISKIGKNI
jgi:hypothetical protein